MEAILPDLNTGYIKYRNKILDSLDSGKILNLIGSLATKNAMLPVEYQVSISDEIYYEKIKQITISKCNHCNSDYPILDEKGKATKETEQRPTEHNFQDVRVYQMMLPIITSFVCGSNYADFWTCKKCKKANRLSKTKFIKTALQKPYYLKVVPESPKRKDGLDRHFLTKSKEWAWNFLYEVEHQMGEYRRNYVSKNQGFENQEVNLDKELETLDLWK